MKRNKFLDTLAFALFLAGSYIIYLKFGKWLAIGVALEMLSVYLMTKTYIDSNYLPHENSQNNKEE